MTALLELGFRTNLVARVVIGFRTRNLVSRVNTEAETGICLLVAEVSLTLEDCDSSCKICTSRSMKQFELNTLLLRKELGSGPVMLLV